MGEPFRLVSGVRMRRWAEPAGRCLTAYQIRGQCLKLGDWRNQLLPGPLENERFLGTFEWKCLVGS